MPRPFGLGSDISLLAVTSDSDTRARLLEAALLLFRQRGYHGVVIRDILEHARAPKGSLYHHFPGGKDQLAVCVLELVAGRVVEMIEGDRASDAAQVMRSVGQRLRKWMQATHARAPLGAGERARPEAEGGGDSSACALIASFAAEGDTAAAVAAAARAAYQRIAAALTARLVASGASPRAARDTAYLAIAALEGGGLVSQTLGEPRLFTAAIEQAAQLCAQAAPASARKDLP